jgi:glycosyltransferase involved in cell wall biosynthesis
MGGVNYFRNLFEALRLLPSPQVEPVIVVGQSADQEIVESFGVSETHVTQWGDLHSWQGILRRSLMRVFERDYLLERYLSGIGINLNSHLGYLGIGARMPSLTWIPDFQERYLPEFFSAHEIKARERGVLRTVKNTNAIVLSSEHAREGLAHFSSKAASDAYVLPFVASVPGAAELLSLETLEQKYGALGQYFFLPNQFWAHKNHEVVLRALRALSQQGKKVRVIATGNLHDHRQPEYGERLMHMLRDRELSDDFRLLGVVPYLDLMSLMAHSVAVLNPSLFEGWSTTVEEAKSLGKTAVLSSIPVHREQRPDRAFFFDPRNPHELAEILWTVLREYDQGKDAVYMRQAELQLPARRQSFACLYESIVTSTI